MNVCLFPDSPSAELVAVLTAAGCEITTVSDVATVVDNAPPTGWDVVVVELPEDPTGTLGAVRRMFEMGSAPLLVVAGRLHTADLLDFRHCDDFILTPVDRLELRVRLRRLVDGPNLDSGDEVLRFKDLELNLATYQATVAGSPSDLTYMEWELLRFFVEHPARVWSREQILSKVWGYDYFGGSRTVDVHVRRLRAKLGEERSSWIATVRSVGYRFG